LALRELASEEQWSCVLPRSRLAYALQFCCSPSLPLLFL
jgi:hypothetical protein